MEQALPDDTILPAEIAALYLRMSPADLADSQKPARPAGRPDKGTKPPAAPLSYTLGVVREMDSRRAGATAPEPATKAGLLAWMSARLPFFAELEPRVKRGPRVLIANAWDNTDARRESRFAQLLAGRIRFTWLTSAEAAASLWSDEESHRAFAARGLALLESEVRTIASAIDATANLGRPQ